MFIRITIKRVTRFRLRMFFKSISSLKNILKCFKGKNKCLTIF